MKISELLLQDLQTSKENNAILKARKLCFSREIQRRTTFETRYARSEKKTESSMDGIHYCQFPSKGFDNSFGKVWYVEKTVDLEKMSINLDSKL